MPSKGADGTNGVDGCYYVPNAETGCFDKVLADGTVEATEISWINEAGVTAVWTNNTLMVYGVQGLPEGQEYIEIALTSTLKSIAYLPETLLNNRGVIDFYALYHTTEKNGAEVCEFVISAPAVAKYNVNPLNADVTGVDWSVRTRGVKTRSAELPTITVVNYVAGTKGKQGYIDFSFVAEGALPTQCTSAQLATDQVLASLVATTKEGEVIISDEAFVQQRQISTYSIINRNKYEKKDSVYAYGTTVPTLEAKADFKLVYNSSINIADSVETYTDELTKALTEINVQPTYKVSLLPEFYGVDKETNQQQFITVSEDGVVTVKEEYLENNGMAALGRTPVVKVTSFVNEKELASVYVKIAIVDEGEDKDAKTFITKTVDLQYNNLSCAHPQAASEIDPVVAKVTWAEAKKEILDVLSMSYAEFVSVYDVDQENKVVTPETLPAGIDVKVNKDYNEPTFIQFVINDAVKENCEGNVKVVFNPKDNNPLYTPVAVEFNYTVSHEHVWPAFNPDYLVPGEANTIQVKGKKDANGTWAMTSEIAEHFYEYSYKDVQGNHYTPIVFSLEKVNGKDQEGAEIKDGKIYLTKPLTETSKDYVVTMTETLHNGNKCQTTYTVRFVNPFVLTLANVELKTLIAEADIVNLKSCVTVKDIDGNVIVSANSNNELVLSDVAKTVYGIKVVPTVEFDEPVYNETGKDTKPTFGGNLNVEGDNMIWDNDGTHLQSNKYAKYAATVTFANICELTEEAKVTVLSTNNSMYPSPAGQQWVYYDTDYEAYLVVDFGVATAGAIRHGVQMDGAWYEDWNVPTYEVAPTSATAGIITSTVEVVDRRTGEVTEITYTISYSDLTEDSVKILSYSDYDKGLEGLGIMKFDENWNVCPVTATKATTAIEFTEMGNEPGMEPLSK